MVLKMVKWSSELLIGRPTHTYSILCLVILQHAYIIHQSEQPHLSGSLPVCGSLSFAGIQKLSRYVSLADIHALAAY